MGVCRKLAKALRKRSISEHSRQVFHKAKINLNRDEQRVKKEIVSNN